MKAAAAAMAHYLKKNYFPRPFLQITNLPGARIIFMNLLLLSRSLKLCTLWWNPYYCSLSLHKVHNIVSSIVYVNSIVSVITYPIRINLCSLGKGYRFLSLNIILIYSTLLRSSISDCNSNVPSLEDEDSEFATLNIHTTNRFNFHLFTTATSFQWSERASCRCWG